MNEGKKDEPDLGLKKIGKIPKPYMTTHIFRRKPRRCRLSK